MRVLIVHKPAAGEEPTSARHLVGAVEACGHSVEYRTADDDWSSIARQCELVVAAGGDGTVGAVLQALAGTASRVTIVPVGTANNIARSLGIDVDDALGTIAQWPTWTPRPFDIWHARGADQSTFVERVGGGLFSDLLVDAEQRRRRVGRDATVGEALDLFMEVLSSATTQWWTVAVDGEDHSGQYIAVEAVNVAQTGPNVVICSSADPGDGHLDVLLLTDDHVTPLRHHVGRLLAGAVATPLDLPVIKGRNVRLASPSGAQFHVDDQLFDGARELLVAPASASATVVAPPADSLRSHGDPSVRV
jgi:diacylglycerol kinase family enzyme